MYLFSTVMRLSAGLILTFAFIIAPSAADEPSPEEVSRGYRSRTLLAKPKVTSVAVEAAETRLGVKVVRLHRQLGGIRTLETDGTTDVIELIRQLNATGLYEYVERDYIRMTRALPNDARFATDQWSLSNTGQSGGTPGADIRATSAWDSQREAPDVIVAVIDTGLRTEHEDIAANVWFNSKELNAGAGLDDDGNQYVDDVNGINATVERASPVSGNPTDEDGHGTHVAGIIGAVGNNGLGVAGVAWKVQLMPLKFISRTSGSVSASIACIDYAISKGAHIINGSYGSLGYSKAEYDALKRARAAGIIFVAAAGNDSLEITEYPEYPAAYQLDNIIAVASTSRQDQLASYSSYGSGLVELAAPGSSILSLGHSATAPYVVKSGTSMAAPHVAGALALLKQRFPHDNYRALINRLLASVDVLPALNNRVHTNGRLNLERALSTSHSRPFNDDFAGRPLIAGEANVVRGSIQHATLEANEPLHAGIAGASGSLWWSWTAPASAGKLTLSTAGSEFDTVLAVYTGNSIATLSLLAGNDDGGPEAGTSALTVDIAAGTTYTIAVSGKPGGQGQLALALNTVPVNDVFANAQILSGPSVVVTGSNIGATPQPGDPRPKDSMGRPIGDERSVWYRWTAPGNHRFHVSVSGQTIDPLVAIYTGTNLANLVEVASNDDAELNLFRYDSLATFNGTAGVNYYIYVDSTFGGGRFNLSINDAESQTLLYDAIYASPAIGADGSVYVADNSGIIAAIKSDGVVKWATSTDFLDFIDGGAIAIGSNGDLHFGTYYGDLYAYTAAGAKQWIYSTESEIWAAPAIAADGTLYVKTDDGQLNAFTPEGVRKWQFAVPGATYTSPVIGEDGTIYLASGGDAALYAITPEGKQKWRAELGASVYSSPAIGADGTLYLGNYDGRFFAIGSNGVRRWQFDTGSPLSGSAVIDGRGYVYFGSYNKKLYALNAATGAKMWEYVTGDIIRSTAPLIADDGTIYIGSDDGFVHAVNPNGTLRRTYATGGPILASPILAAGRLYVASTDAKLHAFEIGANPASSPWPMHRQNLRRTGRAGERIGGIPTFAAQPASVSANIGSPATFTVSTNLVGPGDVTYQWRFNQADIPGAASASFTLPSAQTSAVGAYSVVATGPGGAIVSQSVNLTVNAIATSSSRLVNLAVRSTAGSGDKVLFVGLVVGGEGTTGTKPLLIRAIGPTLATSFGVGGALADPKFELFAAGGTAPIAGNNNWNGDLALAAAAAQLGAFPFSSNDSKDAALVLNPNGGAYTVQLSGVSAESGIVLAEIYDATPAGAFGVSTPRLINVSARTLVGRGDDILIAGFVIAGSGSKKVMVRAIGPTLGDFGVTGVLANPKLNLFTSGSSTAIAANDDWGSAVNANEVAATASRVGAFALLRESRDAVLLLTLPPGSYTAQVSGVNDTTGAAIVEVYEVP